MQSARPADGDQGLTGAFGLVLHAGTEASDFELPSHIRRFQQGHSRGCDPEGDINMADEMTMNANIFINLRGTWRLRRSLRSALPGFPSGIFEGTATFTPRKPSAHSVKLELLYTEQGELKTDNGFTLKANRKYIYRYNDKDDKISAWFVKEETKDQKGKEEVENLFHDLEMEDGKTAVVARGEHLCSKDMYSAYYEFRMPKVSELNAEDEDDEEDDEDEEMKVWGLRYKVKGPQKDYTSETAYERTYSADLPSR